MYFIIALTHFSIVALYSLPEASTGFHFIQHSKFIHSLISFPSHNIGIFSR